LKIAIEKHLASSLNRRDQQPNIELAREIDRQLSENPDHDLVHELLQIARSGRKAARYDAVKVIYELGRMNPLHVTPFAEQIITLANTRDSRMIWAILQVLNILCDFEPALLMNNLNQLLAATDRSSVIASDNMMKILAKLNNIEDFSQTITPILLQRLTYSAPNQFPTYAELAAATIPGKNREQLLRIIDKRLTAIASGSKRKRLLRTRQNLSSQNTSGLN